jgi:acyl carrier protein
MDYDSSLSPSAALRRDRIERVLKNALAQVRVINISEIEQQFVENGSNLEMDSQEAISVIANVEEELKCTLPGPEQLKPGQLASIRGLCELVEGYLDSLGVANTEILEKLSSAV